MSRVLISGQTGVYHLTKFVSSPVISYVMILTTKLLRIPFVKDYSQSVRAAARNPEDGGEEAPTLPLRANVILVAGAKEGQNLLPLLIAEG